VCADQRTRGLRWTAAAAEGAMRRAVLASRCVCCCEADRTILHLHAGTKSVIKVNVSRALCQQQRHAQSPPNSTPCSLISVPNVARPQIMTKRPIWLRLLSLRACRGLHCCERAVTLPGQVSDTEILPHLRTAAGHSMCLMLSTLCAAAWC
jgi:hypothetical protein